MAGGITGRNRVPGGGAPEAGSLDQHLLVAPAEELSLGGQLYVAQGLKRHGGTPKGF